MPSRFLIDILAHIVEVPPAALDRAARKRRETLLADNSANRAFAALCLAGGDGYGQSTAPKGQAGESTR